MRCKETCDAEIGKHGNFRTCMKPAKWRSQFNFHPFTILNYCDDHKSHSSNPTYASQTRTLTKLI